MKSSKLYQEMTEWGKAHDQRRKEHEETKAAIIAIHGYDSPEAEAWYAREAELRNEDPFGDGAWRAYRAVRWNEAEELEVTESCWPKEYEGFIKTLREFGCKTFLVTNQSTGLMRDIFGYIENGCRMVGPELIWRKENRYGTEEMVKHEALRFEIN